MKRSQCYKTCAVPMCGNTTINNPGKLFIHVPKVCEKRRKQWLELARRDPNFTSKKTDLYFCEDHFDMPNDMENYFKYNMMGFVAQIIMKPDCCPSKFDCQPDIVRRTVSPMFRSAVSRKWQLDIMREIISEATSVITNSNVIQSYNEMKGVSTNPENKTATQISQISSKAEQTSATNDKNTSFKTKPKTKSKRFINKVKKKLLFKSQTKSSDQDSISELKKKIETQHLSEISTENTIRLIKKMPIYFIGIPKDCYFLIDLIHKQTKLPENQILLCLKKIRLNTPFFELGYQFGMSESYIKKIFKKTVPLIAKVLRPFIIESNKAVKRNLNALKQNIDCIIHFLEIVIEKQSDSLFDYTWSEYKKANTVKYLISSNTDGIINYISSGYGGRMTDVYLVQNCSFFNCLKPGVSLSIVVDRGFENIEKQVNKTRLSSTNSKAKHNVIETKEIANIHIERVIKRFREFSMLNSSVVSKEMLKYLDDCVIIACALINLQGSRYY